MHIFIPKKTQIEFPSIKQNKPTLFIPLWHACSGVWVHLGRKVSILNNGHNSMEIFLCKEGGCWDIVVEGMCMDEGEIELFKLFPITNNEVKL